MENEPNIVVTDELIARYLAGEAEPLEAMALYDWQELSSENQLYFYKMKQAWEASIPSKAFVVPNVSQDWDYLERIIDQPVVSEVDDITIPLPETKTYTDYRWIFKIAASVIVFLGIGIVAYTIIGKKFQTPEIASIASESNAILEQKLPDNSHVVLSANSKLTYVKDFIGDTRDVELAGEAYFQVTPDIQRPFIIHADKAQIKVVGTTFNVNAAGNAVIVSVTSGKVQLSTSDTAVILIKGQTGTWIKNSHIINVTSEIDENALGYATRRLDFRGVMLKDVITDIEKMYSCKISLKNNNLADCLFTAHFVDMPLNEVLNTIAEIFSLKIEKITTNEFYLEGGHCP